jgi:hypothetical protein
MTREEPTAAGSAEPRPAPAAILLPLAVLFAACTAATWARWGHVRFDCGGALERAALVAGGAVLYRDVLSPYGPLPDYTMAALFRVFGTHLTVAYAAGLLLLAAQSWALWAVGRRFLGAFECAVALATFWILLGFRQGLFNWVLPNTFASTFGAFFATATVATAITATDRGSLARLAGASVCAAAAGLSKVEFGAAAAGTLVVVALLFPVGGRGRARSLMAALVPGLLLTLAAAAAVLAAVPWRTLVDDNLYRVRSFRMTLPAYKAGLFPPLGPVLAAAALRYGLELPLRAAAVAAGLAFAAGRGRARRGAGVLLAAGTLLVPLVPGYPPLAEFVRLPGPERQFYWTPLVWAALGIGAAMRYRQSGSAATRALVPVAAASVLLTLRWDFRLAWPSYYAPFAPLLLPLLVRPLAARLVPARAALATALVLAVPVAVAAVAGWRGYQGLAFTLAYPRGTIRTFGYEGAPLRAVIDRVRAGTAPGDHVAVLPEERLVNFLAEHPHPTRDPGVGPGWLASPADEERFLAELEAKGTRMVVVSSRRYPEFGVTDFASYSPGIMAHVRRAYPRVWRSGAGIVRYTVYEK